MKNKCILDSRRKDGGASREALDPHTIALHGLNGEGGRVGAAGAPKDYRYLTLANSPARDGMEKLYGALDKYVETFSRQFDKDGERIKSFYLYSDSPGTGKTTTAVALMNEFIMSNYLGALRNGVAPPQMPAMFFDLNAVQRTYNIAVQSDDKDTIRQVAQKFEKAASVPFLVLDDVSIRSASESFTALLHDVVNHRATTSLPTIYTSNVSLDDLERTYGARVFDRVRDKCVEIKFSGGSRRGK